MKKQKKQKQNKICQTFYGAERKRKRKKRERNNQKERERKKVNEKKTVWIKKER